MKDEIKDFLLRNKSKKTFQNAVKKYSPKFFFERYEETRNYAVNSSSFFHALSIICAIAFWYYLIMQVIPYWHFSLILGISIPLAFERFKKFVITKSFNIFYQNNERFDLALMLGFIVSLSCIGFSVFTSLEGAHQVITNNDYKLESFKDYTNYKKDSVNNHYDSLIQNEMNSLYNYKESVSWLGQIDMSNKTNKQVIKNKDAEISELKKEKREALKSLNLTSNQKSEKLQELTFFNAKIVVCISAFIEVMIILLCWFPEYFDYRTAKDSSTISFNNEITLSLDKIQQIINLTNPLNTKFGILNENQNKIGFKSGLEKSESINEGLKTALLAGERNYQKLCVEHSTNPRTIKKYIDKYCC